MDVLSDVLGTMHLQSKVKFLMELTAPWGISAPAFDHKAIFYVVKRGSCYIGVEGLEAQVPLVGGDLVMLPHGQAHTLRDHPETPAEPLGDGAKGCTKHTVCETFRHGGGGCPTTILVGSFIFENQAAKSFLSTFAPLIHIQGEDGQVVPWLGTTLRWMAAEASSKHPGGEIMASHLTDMLFIQILRAHIAENAYRKGICKSKAGWLCAIGDPNIGKAFELIHEKPERPWTVANLASEVNMSRTAFAVRFSESAGVTPLAYLTRWRMLKAGKLLRSSTATIFEIAMRVGYESEASFGKAFKREMGVAPGMYRKGEANGVLAGLQGVVV